MRVHCNPLPPDARFTQREGGEGRRKGWRESRNDNLGEGRKGRGGGGETSLLYAFIKLLYIDHTGQINLVPLESPRVSEGLSMALLQGRMSTEYAKKKKKSCKVHTYPPGLCLHVPAIGQSFTPSSCSCSQPRTMLLTNIKITVVDKQIEA